MTVQHHKVRIAVIDSGSGIPLEFKQKIFSQFGQAHSAVGSTGLGLNIAKSIVEQHQGTISFETSCDGTTFYIDLPAC